jgi:hypothetical protein
MHHMREIIFFKLINELYNKSASYIYIFKQCFHTDANIMTIALRWANIENVKRET